MSGARAVAMSSGRFPPLEVDHTITDWVVAHRVGWLDDAFSGITIAGNTVTMTVIAILTTVGLLARRRVIEAAMVGGGSISGYLLMIGLKRIVARDRPPAADRLIQIDTYAFPSGHAMMSAVVLGLSAVVLGRSRGRRRVWLAVAVVASTLIGVSRVYLGVHWAGDVIAGWAIGAAWVAIVLWLVRWSGTRSARAARRGRRADSIDAAR